MRPGCSLSTALVTIGQWSDRLKRLAAVSGLLDHHCRTDVRTCAGRSSYSDDNRRVLTNSTNKKGMTAMRAVQVTSPGGPFVMVEREIPQPGPRQVRVKVQACG